MENLLDLLRNRRSTRVFKETQISPELVELLMKAVLMAPSSKRSNPWQFVLVDDPLKLKELSGCKKSGSQLLANASLAVVVLADPEKSDVWIEDASIASIIIQLEAEDLGLGSCWVQIRKRQNENGIDSEACVRAILNIPDSLAVLSIIALGVKGESRKPFGEDKLQWEKIHLNAFGLVE
jgi:nitroreductase